jgi:hypothetical protein
MANSDAWFWDHSQNQATIDSLNRLFHTDLTVERNDNGT